MIVLLSGEAADELFGGYVQRYRRYRQFKRLEAWLKYLPPTTPQSNRACGYASDRAYQLRNSRSMRACWLTRLHSWTALRALNCARCAATYRSVKDDMEREVLGAMLADVTNFLTPLLRRLDRMTMAASVECRVPFLDQRLVRTVINMPLSLRSARQHRQVGTESHCRGLPAE